jgi:hypothetical protein
MLFSTDWHLREAGIKRIKEEIILGKASQLLGTQDPQELFTAAMRVASKVTNDKIAQVAMEGMNLIIDACKTIPSSATSSNPEMRQHAVKICLGLMEKIGDNNARLRERTEEAAFSLAH